MQFGKFCTYIIVIHMVAGKTVVRPGQVDFTFYLPATCVFGNRAIFL